MTEIEIVLQGLENAYCPEDIFGIVQASIPGIYRLLARSVHPDTHPSDPYASEALQRVNTLHGEVLQRVADGTYGKRMPFKWKTPVMLGKYKVSPNPIKGDISDVYKVLDKNYLVKVARNHDDNDLMVAEAESLEIMKNIPLPVREGIPALIDSFKISGKWKREANVVTNFDGFISVKTVKDRLDSVDPRMVVWFFKRCLRLIGWSHHLGIIHGAINPDHVLVFPDNSVPGRDFRKHSIRLIDWSYSVRSNRTRLTGAVPQWENFYAPEILDRKLTRSSDVYSAAKVVKFLYPKDLPKELENIIQKCVDKSPEKRYSSTNECFEAWAGAAKKVYGEPRWAEFVV